MFQETRQIIGATIQVITYQEFVPALLGGKATELIQAYSGFKPEVEPAISVEFSTAAYRLHGMIRVNFEAYFFYILLIGILSFG